MTYDRITPIGWTEWTVVRIRERSFDAADATGVASLFDLDDVSDRDRHRLALGAKFQLHEFWSDGPGRHAHCTEIRFP